MHKISIVTISYNHGRFIEDAINSVLSQEGKFFIDYVIVDGGSSDNTLTILQKYATYIKNQTYPLKCLGCNFRYISEPDKGPSNALNKGLKMIEGDYVGILNSDDFYYKGCFKKILDAFESYPDVDAVYGKTIFVDEMKNFMGIHKGKKDLKFEDFHLGDPITQPSVFIKKSVFNRVGLFDENFKFSYDHEFFIRSLKKGIKFFYIPEFVVFFRVRKDALSSGRYMDAFVETLTVQLKYFGFDRWIIYNLGLFSYIYAKKTEKSFDECFFEIKNSFNDKNPNFRIYGEKEKKARRLGYLKYSIYKIGKSEKGGIEKYLKKIIVYFNILFLSDDNIHFLLFLLMTRTWLVGMRIYSKVKNLFKLNNLRG
ncbi:MAG: glycosyltransferase [Candidatus Omnitrophica bacterium]|nr:glycosyltransferase [Candidatus Omnitrophota bacterium]